MLGWTMDAFDYFIVVFVYADIAKTFHHSKAEVAFITTATLVMRPVGALLFTCGGRGRRMFGVADHDAATIQELLGGIPLAGFFAAGEIGPIAGRNALHAFTASMALFIDDTT